MSPRSTPSAATRTAPQPIPLDAPLVTGTLVKRYKRFLADVACDDGTARTAHCPNSGSMLGMKDPGLPVLLSDSQNPARKLSHTLEFVQVDDGGGPTWVGVNTSRPNAIVEHALRQGLLPDIDPDVALRREVRYGQNSRVDLLASPEGGPQVWIEVKNTTLAARHDDGTLEARFPDAVTTRGQKHMEELAQRVAAGDRAMVVFLVNRADCTRFAVASDIDAAYAEVLDQAREAGVEVVPLQVSNRVQEEGAVLAASTTPVGELTARWA